MLRGGFTNCKFHQNSADNINTSSLVYSTRFSLIFLPSLYLLPSTEQLGDVWVSCVWVLRRVVKAHPPIT
ncbi:hypothetical protein L211DRAFT_497338 [Terfezia boudieri ATCC MYA-4762]|uniref:Uncharacterized protein n=1 Tax=Terfezia boudieri ATCC MYA-4762 TaxID=1051890 RepID=A0A3N4LHD5_9PEZI|nr:hypothetical protein L211DRAFT_497338 [Terfezia boudieri ATCC MYA-4762]